MLIISVFFAYLIYPIIAFLEKKHIPFIANILIIYTIFAVILFLMAFFLIPKLTIQLNILVKNIPSIIDNVNAFIKKANIWYDNIITDQLRVYVTSSFSKFLTEFEHFLIGFIKQILSFSFNLLAILSAFLIIPLFTFYLLKDYKNYKKNFVNFLPANYKPVVLKALEEIGSSFSGFIRGQVFVAIFIGVMVSIILAITGVDYSLIIGIIAGFFELIPFIGAFIGAIIGILMAFLKSPVIGIIVAVLFVLVYEFESKFIYPNIIAPYVGLSPFIVILAIFIGGELGGIFGMFIAVPLTSILSIVFKHLFKCFYKLE